MTRPLPLLALLTLLAACAAPPAPRPGPAPDAPDALDGEDRCFSTVPAATDAATAPEEVPFETLCPAAFTSDFVASLQRALKVRGLYGGEVDGLSGPELGRAVQAFQGRSGPDSPVLSLEAARDLGLVPLSREEIARL